MNRAVLLVFALIAAGLNAVNANCGPGFCDSMPNGDFALGRMYFEQKHKIVKSYHATIEVIPGTPIHVIEALGAKAASSKNLLLMAADYGTDGTFSAKPVTVPKGSNVKLMMRILLPLAKTKGYCQVKSRQGKIHHKIDFNDIAVGEWVDYSSAVVVPITDRTVHLECNLEATTSSDHSALFEYLRLCISYPPGKGLQNGGANYNLLYSELAADQAAGWIKTTGVDWAAGDKGKHTLTFKKTASEERFSRIFDTYPHRAYSLSGILNEDLSYMPLKFFINNVRVKPVYRAPNWDISSKGTQFHVLIANPGKKLNITIVKDRRESCEHIVRYLGLYAHGCVVPKVVARRSTAEHKQVHDEL